MLLKENPIIFYVCLLEIFACSLFFLSFFALKSPITVIASKSDFPSAVNEHKLDVQDVYRRRYNKIVIVIVDALRFDFIADGNHMPFLFKVFQNHNASCLVSAKTDVPTVTLPRIKSIVTGDVSEFLDLILNFGATELAQDNIISQAVSHGLNILFYGDDTWLRLFPKTFKRFEGTTSFFVNDFYEVDHNVTRNLKRELLNSDWDVMILHYLGLDHIGHVEGPKGPSIPGKLKEMDDVFRMIFEYFKDLGEDGLIILTGDHGMKDSGGHGGSSFEEITVPVAIINGGCDRTSNGMVIDQVDLVPLLAISMGVPIPAASIGHVHPKLLENLLQPSELLYALYYNTARMKSYLSPPMDHQLEELMSEGMKSYASGLYDGFKTDELHIYERHFLSVQKHITSNIPRSNKTGVSSLLIAITLLAQAIVCLLLKGTTLLPSLTSSSSKCVRSCCFIGTVVIFMAGYFKWALVCGMALILANCYVILTEGIDVKVLMGINPIYWFMLILHPMTFLSTSFIEEEHLFWYTTFSTLIVLMARIHSRKSLPDLALILVVHRCLQSLNATGIKWANISDLGDWLRAPENHVLMTSYYLIGVILTMSASWRCASSKYFKSILFILTMIQGTSVCLYYVAVTKNCQLFFHYPKSSGFWEVKCFWIATILRTSLELRNVLRHCVGSFRPCRPCMLAGVLVQLVISTLCLLMEPQNAILPAAMVYVSWRLKSPVEDMKTSEVLSHWIGTVYFFLSGNSNSISTIDVTAGFKGVDECNIFFAGLFITLHTFAFPILAFLLTLEHLLRSEGGSPASAKSRHADVIKLHLLLNACPTLVFMIVSLIQREHLFIWSVFSPKLLYTMCQTLISVSMVVISAALL
ncbi:Metalloenzyme superfamily [Nesidiocoris tenuis]|uniref:Metalloenzyme superfamily n=1 Tax=Nesidiocoris tenuis TaxID=355587 RepID=A0ABN7AGM1_9HEMI|nr:Metalloenzyme superfamily [Nesidiocoris tenuis]